jgi:hypothetical protein
VFTCIESAFESLTNITGTNKIVKKTLAEIISKAVRDLGNSFSELKSSQTRFLKMNNLRKQNLQPGS